MLPHDNSVVRCLLDEMLKPGIHLINGAPKTGKTTLALQIAIEAARKEYDVLFCGESDFVSRLQLITGDWPAFDNEYPNFQAYVGATLSFLEGWMESEASSFPMLFLDCDFLESDFSQAFVTMRLLKEWGARFKVSIVLVRTVTRHPDISAATFQGSDPIDGMADSILCMQGGTASSFISRDGAEIPLIKTAPATPEILVERNDEPGYFASARIYPFGKSTVAGNIEVLFDDEADDWAIFYNIQVLGVRPLADVQRLIEAQQLALQIAAGFQAAVEKAVVS